MLTKTLHLAVALLFGFTSICVGQKRIISIPFEFEKKFFDTSQYNVYFLNSPADSAFTLVLRDNKKAQYVLFDRNLKQVAKMDAEKANTVFAEKVTQYRGGTMDGRTYRFIYEKLEEKSFGKKVYSYQLEVVDFDAKKIYHSDLFEIPKTERLLSSFSENNMYFTITADDKAKELVVYAVNNIGQVKERRVAFPIPSSAGKKRDKVSEYLQDIEVFLKHDQPEMSSAIAKAKLFPTPDNLFLVVNDGNNPVHLLSLQPPEFKLQEKFFSLDELKSGTTVNSYYHMGKLFTVGIEKDAIKILVHDVNSGNLVKKYEIKDEADMLMLAGLPVTEKRLEGRVDTKDIESVKKLIKSLDKGREGIQINSNNKGQLVITLASYRTIYTSPGLIDYSSHTSGPTTTTTTKEVPTGDRNFPTQKVIEVRYSPGRTYASALPGKSPSLDYASRNYISTTCYIVLDSSANKAERAGNFIPISTQIKDYIDAIGHKVKATNQFSIGKREFFGYYDKDSKAYVVDEIRVR